MSLVKEPAALTLQITSVILDTCATYESLILKGIFKPKVK